MIHTLLLVLKINLQRIHNIQRTGTNGSKREAVIMFRNVTVTGVDTVREGTNTIWAEKL